MRSVRRATSSLLRQSIRQSQSAALTLNYLSTPYPSSPAPVSLALPPTSRSFSRNSLNYVKKAVNTPPMDLQTALKTFHEIQDSETLQLTKNQASALVAALAKHKCHDQCVELLRRCQEHNVHVKPFARLAGFGVLCQLKKFELVLNEFELLRSDKDSYLMPWVFAGVLDAATKLNRQEVVEEIFQQLVKGSKEEQVQVSGGNAYEMFKDVRGRGVKLLEFALQTLVVYAQKSNQPDMAMEVFSMMKKERVEATSDVFEPLILACGNAKRWRDVIEAFSDMPEMLAARLHSLPLGFVVMAHTQSESEELKLRGLDLFGEHKEKWSIFACTAALEGLLQTRQFEVLLALANDMKHHGIEWDASVYKTVTLANIRNGSIEKALQLLRDNGKRMRSDCVVCYRELIEYYANSSGDAEEACQLYLEMMQNKLKLNFSDWCNALQLALQFSDQTLYWNIRKQLWLNSLQFTTELPAYLLLPHPEGPEQHEQETTKTDIYSSVALAREIFRDIQGANGVGLKKFVATKLLKTMAQYDRVDDCVEMWRFFEQRGVLPTPVARVYAFDALCKAKKYDHALEMFKTLMIDESAPRAWTYSKALDAAIKLKRHAFVAEILRHMHAHDVKITANDYTHIIKSCTRVKEWTLALSMISAMRSQRMKPSSSTFNLLLTGCGKDKFWNMVIKLYNGMPDDLRPLLEEEALGSVLLAHSQAESEELQLRTVGICNEHMATCKPFPYDVALVALLQAKQLSEAISLAADATSQGLTWTPSMCRSVVMAHIRSGAMEQARGLLDENARRMSNMSVECYRELIQYYAEVRGDKLEASQLCVQMMQNNTEVTVNDWRIALELALQLPDRAIYWELRKWLRLHGGAILSGLREHLLLPDDDQQHDNAASLQ